MRCVISPASGRIEVADVPVPRIGPGEVLLRLAYCGLCGTDVTKVAAAGRTTPVALGHEVTGFVAQAGPEVELAVGSPVVVAHHVPDPASHFTRRGSPTMDPGFKATNIDPAGFAEWVRVPAALVRETLLPLPPEVPLLRGIFAEPLACCLRALDRLALAEGDTVLLVGAGGTGMLFAPLLRDRSVKLLVAEVRPERIDMAQQWGAAQGWLVGRDAVAEKARADTESRGVDAVILTVVTPEVWRLAIHAVRDGGALLLFGAWPGALVEADLYALWRREVSLVSSYASTPEMLPRALALLRRPGWELEQMVSHCLPLEAAAEAVALVLQRRAGKVVLSSQRDGPA